MRTSKHRSRLGWVVGGLLAAAIALPGPSSYAQESHPHHGAPAAPQPAPFVASTAKSFAHIALKPTGGEAKGFVVARNLGVVDSLEVFLFKLKPQTAYNVYVSGQRTPVATFKTNPAGAANGTAIGPLREVVSTLSAKTASPANIFVIEGDATPDPAKAVLVSAQ